MECLQQQPNESQALALALYNEGIALFQTGQPQAALSKYEAALRLFHSLGWRSWEGGTLSRIGNVYYWLGQYEQALESYQQALAIHREISDRAWERTTLNYIGGVYRDQGQYRQALESYEQALVIEQEISDQVWKGLHLHNIGVTYRHLEQYEQALHSFKQALFIRRHLGDRAGEGETLNSIGVVYHSLRQYDQALDFYQQALAIKRDISDRIGEGVTLNNIGGVYHDQKQYEQALEYYQQALTIRQDIGDRQGEEQTLNNIRCVYKNQKQSQQHTQANVLRDEGHALFQTDQLLAALSKYELALPLVQAAGCRNCEGATLNHIGRVYERLGQYEQALDFYRQALTIAQAIGSREGEGATLQKIADIYDRLGPCEQALDYYQQAFAIQQNIGEAKWLTLIRIGRVYSKLGQYEQALESYQQALTICRESGDREGEGAVFNNIGLVYEGLGQYQQALDYHQQALTICRDIGNTRTEGTVLNNIGLIYNEMGGYQQALEYYLQALVLRRDSGYRQGEGVTFNNIASVYDSLGQHQQALEYYQQALLIHREIGNREYEGNTLNGIGLIYSILGQYKQALNYLHQALEIKQNISDRATEGITVGNIGFVYELLGQYHQALDYYQQALAFHQSLGARGAEGTMLSRIGSVYLALRQGQQALAFYLQSLPIARKIGDREGEGSNLFDIGYLYEMDGYTAQAITFYQQAIAVKESIQDDLKIEELKASYADKQVDHYEQLIALLWNEGHLEAIPFYISSMESPFRVAGVFEGNYRVLPNLIEVTISKATIYCRDNCSYRGQTHLTSIQVGLGANTESEWIIERSSQSLPVDQVMQPDETYSLIEACFLIPIDSFTELSKHWLVFELEQVSLDLDQSVGYSYAHSERNIFRRFWRNPREIEGFEYPVKQQLLETHQGSQSNLRNAYLEQAFNYVERSRARAFLDQFANGPINFRTGVSAELLQEEETLKAQIVALRTQLTQLLTQERSLQHQIAALRTQLVKLRSHPNNQSDTEAIAAVQKQLLSLEKNYTNLLTELKLQSPEAASLVSVDVATLDEIQSLLDADTTLVEYFLTKNLILAFIITRESFQTIGIEVSREDLTKKIESFRGFGLKNLRNPHPKSLQQLYQWLIAPLKSQLNTSQLAIVPHGVLHYLPFAALSTGERYLCDDYTITTLPSASILRFLPQKRKPSTGTLLALGNPTTPLPSLPSAEKEVNAIASLYGTQPLIGAAATESAVFSQAGNAEILHLSVHGEFNKHNPLFSTLHLTADEQHDGRLEVHDIYALDLTKATNLVSLSACQTQLGELSRGDEVVGLNRAFLYAGTPSVVATLWSVQDDTTALLMKRFYTHLRSGIAKAQALRQAQIEVRAEYPHPYYWAAFVLTGDGYALVTSFAKKSQIS